MLFVSGVDTCLRLLATNAGHTRPPYQADDSATPPATVSTNAATRRRDDGRGPPAVALGRSRRAIHLSASAPTTNAGKMRVSVATPRSAPASAGRSFLAAHKLPTRAHSQSMRRYAPPFQ